MPCTIHGQPRTDLNATEDPVLAHALPLLLSRSHPRPITLEPLPQAPKHPCTTNLHPPHLQRPRRATAAATPKLMPRGLRRLTVTVTTAGVVCTHRRGAMLPTW